MSLLGSDLVTPRRHSPSSAQQGAVIITSPQADAGWWWWWWWWGFSNATRNSRLAVWQRARQEWAAGGRLDVHHHSRKGARSEPRERRSRSRVPEPASSSRSCSFTRLRLCCRRHAATLCGKYKRRRHISFVSLAVTPHSYSVCVSGGLFCCSSWTLLIAKYVPAKPEIS